MSADTTTPILLVEDLVKEYPGRQRLIGRERGAVKAVRGVSFHVAPGETLAIVGESGSGKTTVAKTIMGFEAPTQGRIEFEGRDITRLRPAAWRPLRRELQFVFQDPYASLPSRMPIGDIIAEPLRIHGVGDRDARRARVRELLGLVGLRPEFAARYPHEFSGGQRQRVGIARALALEPRMLILDEPVSALDVSIQAQVINLLADLQAELGLSYLFIAHDLAVVRHIAHRVAVMYLGEIVEQGSTESVFDDPQHDYTRRLLASVPVPDPRLRRRGVRHETEVTT
ncbi:ATP-binding cassette domain-containing protein [Microbacterium sp. NPDC028030]|uniref:ABC transporter ATP-binding protein n=1 Tax=Microbacterium sp. NPDC028030 TaxID=3155124 RepID=UPI0033E54A2D